MSGFYVSYIRLLYWDVERNNTSFIKSKNMQFGADTDIYI